MSKKNDELNNVKTKKQAKPKKSAYEKRKVIMKIAGWVMALVMILGSIISIFGMLIYYR